MVFSDTYVFILGTTQIFHYSFKILQIVLVYTGALEYKMLSLRIVLASSTGSRRASQNLLGRYNIRDTTQEELSREYEVALLPLYGRYMT